MIPRLLLLLFLMVPSIVISACEGEQEQYSGFSDLVAERNQARRAISEESARKKKQTIGQPADKALITEPDRSVSEKDLYANALYEKNVKIVDSLSGAPLARGVAYLNKKGRIVRIKIIKE